MFDLKRPCVSCPFRKGQGPKYQLARDRLREIFYAQAFQCHKTVNYDADTPVGRADGKPQQCAGLMSLLHRENRANTIMQVGERLGGFDPSQLVHDDVYANIDGVFRAHGLGCR